MSSKYNLDDYSDLFSQAEKEYNLPPGLLYRVAKQESAGNPDIVSDAGAQGLMQIMPDTAKSLGIDPFNPQQAITGAAKLLRQNIDRYKNVPDALRAYNSGTDPKKWNNPETNNYVEAITGSGETQSQPTDPLMARAAQLSASSQTSPTANTAPESADPLMARAEQLQSGVTETNLAPITPQQQVIAAQGNVDAEGKPTISEPKDVIESLPTGIVKGINELPQLPGNLYRFASQVGAQAGNKLHNAVYDTPFTPEQQAEQIANAGNDTFGRFLSSAPTINQMTGGYIPKEVGLAIATPLEMFSDNNLTQADLQNEAANYSGDNALHQPVTESGQNAENIAASIPQGRALGIGALPSVGGAIGAEIANDISANNPVAQLIGGIAGGGAGKGLSSAGEALAGKSALPEVPIADNILKKAVSRDNTTPSDVNNKLSSMGPEGMLADAAGENTRGVARAIANMPGEAREIAMKALEERQAGQADRIEQAALGNLNVDPEATYHGTTEDLMAQRATQAKPLYDKAFEGGSIAPLESQFEGTFRSDNDAKVAADKAVSDAQQQLTLAKAQEARAGNNVYQTSDANNAIKSAESTLEKAQQQQVAAQAKLDDTTNTLRQAQADRENGVKGAVWSPRIQQFLNDPIVQQGLKQGLEIQRLESLADGTPFNPSEYSVTGTDEAGNPVVSKVPNMRTLDAAKRGLDNIIESYRDPTTGKLVLDQRGRAVNAVKNALVNELDRINPDYAAARKAWAGPSQSMDAMDMGRKFINKDASINEKVLSGLSEGDKEFFRLGAAAKISDILQNSPDGADTVKRIFGSPAKRARLAAIFPSEEAFRNFEKVVNNEKEFTKTYQAATKGARTTPLAEDVADLRNNINKLADNSVNIGRHAIELGKRNIIGKAAYIGGHALSKIIEPKPLTSAESIDLANKLFSTNADRNGATPANLAGRNRNILARYINRLAEGSGIVNAPAATAARIPYQPINPAQQNP